MRVYVPSTLPGLAAWAADGIPAPVAARAVTPAVREWYTEGDQDELEFATLLAAARASLDLLDLDVTAPRRRVVVAVDVPDAQVSPAPGDDRSGVQIGIPLRTDAIVSLHVDEPDSEAVVSAAVTALFAAANGDEDAMFALDEVEACDLLWYDRSELDDLL